MTTRTTLDVKPEHLAIVRNILGEHVPTEKVCAFGSRIEGKARPYSDLDLVIMTHEPLPLATLAELREAFAESDLPWKVDLLDWASLTAGFRRAIGDNLMTINAGSLQGRPPHTSP